MKKLFLLCLVLLFNVNIAGCDKDVGNETVMVDETSNVKKTETETEIEVTIQDVTEITSESSEITTYQEVTETNSETDNKSFDIYESIPNNITVKGMDLSEYGVLRYKEEDTVARAYLSKDMSILETNRQKELYKMATEVIEQYITNDMTDLEKEKIIHDYMVYNMTYDVDKLDENADLNTDSGCAYGFLKNKKGICYGYSRTFQLFMDMLEIPCMLVFEGDEHSWNIVYINDKWYYVDVTWDDPVPDNGHLSFLFFNANADFFVTTGHCWDESIYPEADEYMDKSLYKNFKITK